MMGESVERAALSENKGDIESRKAHAPEK